MMKRDVGISFVFNLLFGEFYFGYEEIHDFDGFLLDAGFDAVSLCKVIKGLKHVNSLLDCCHLLEGEVNDVLVHDVQLFYSCFESIVLLVPI